jgi:uncharacterized repeat protein (TIGR03803 family)
MNIMSKWTTVLAVVTLLLSAVDMPQLAQAQTITTLYSFCPDTTDGICADGETPFGGLVQATNGDLYGTTATTVFKITPSGTLTTLYSFTGAYGTSPTGTLIQGRDLNLYGTTTYGGDYNSGTVFKITPQGTLTTLFSFCPPRYCYDGAYPNGSLIQGTDGNFYGTTAAGGVAAGNEGPASYFGTVFKITPGGKLTTLHSFCSQTNCADGMHPAAGLVQATNGNFYGTTLSGGPLLSGTVFQMTPDGTLTTVYNFCSLPDCADGAAPYAGLVQASDGNLYGTTSGYPSNPPGTIFRLSLSGALTTVYNFCSLPGCADGAVPYAGLVQGSDGNLYGTTGFGGAYGGGTIFSVTLSGALTGAYSFCAPNNCPYMGNSSARMMQATNGDFYGASPRGGDSSVCGGGCGTVYSLSVGLAPFVETTTTSGKVGATVRILGTDLRRASSVTFNGTAATFTVNSTGSEITATVPTGATSGPVQVMTESGTLNSNKPFTVTP